MLRIRSIRTKLIVFLTIVILVPSLLISVVSIKVISHQMLRQAQAQVSSDLRAAREIYNNKLNQIKDTLRLIASRRLLISALENQDTNKMLEDLQLMWHREGLDVLVLTDATGKVVCRAQNPESLGDDQSQDEIVAYVLEHQEPIAGTTIVPREQLLKESPALAERAYMKFTPTPKAKPRKETEETSGMMLKAAVPVYHDNKFIGILYGGELLNHNYELVDKIREIVFGNATYRGRQVGTATIFQWDLRISTNVQNLDGTRAITTRIAAEVYEAVLEQGRTWTDEAFVVNDWYITAYEPIKNINDKIIGILYVGTLKRPFVDTFRKTLMLFLGIVLVTLVVVSYIAYRVANIFTAPLRQMAEIAHRIAEGDYQQKITVNSEDEIGYLAESFNRMTQELNKALKELQDWGKTLEQKVEERTREIERIHRQFLQAEKMASLGKLAAGVAHEINNPMTAILTNSSLLLEELPPDDPRREDVETIVNETMRCRKIVRALLDFARQTKPEKKLTNPNQIIERCISLVENQAFFRNIQLIKDLNPEVPETMLDIDQFQQVIVNILINAAEAMDTKGGKITIKTRFDAPRKTIMISIADTGCGIPEEHLPRLFDPFFTTKEHGTGLGLAISYGIIEHHGGKIEVSSKLGEGSTFLIQLPVAT